MENLQAMDQSIVSTGLDRRADAADIHFFINAGRRVFPTIARQHDDAMVAEADRKSTCARGSWSGWASSRPV